MMNVDAQPHGKTLGLRYLCLTAKLCLEYATGIVLGLVKEFLEYSLLSYMVEPSHMLVQ